MSGHLEKAHFSHLYSTCPMSLVVVPSIATVNVDLYFQTHTADPIGFKF